MENSLNTHPRFGELRYFPVLFFASVMGLSGFSIVLHTVSPKLGLPVSVAEGAAYTTLLVLSLIAVTYVFKLVKYPSTVMDEALHPSRLGFVATVSVAILLCGTALLPFNLALSKALWWVGVLLHLALMLRIVSLWISYTKFRVLHVNPAWFIPVVGSLVIPLAGVKHAPVDVSWFFFSIGLLFWIVLFSIVLNRIMFHNPLPHKLVPTLFILMAPPSVAFISYLGLSETVGDLGRMLYAIALFMFLVVMAQYKKYLELREFYLSWWTFSFPLAAMTKATFTAAEFYSTPMLEYLGWGMAGLLGMIVTMLVYMTLKGLYSGEICSEEQIGQGQFLEQTSGESQ